MYLKSPVYRSKISIHVGHLMETKIFGCEMYDHCSWIINFCRLTFKWLTHTDNSVTVILSRILHNFYWIAFSLFILRFFFQNL